MNSFFNQIEESIIIMFLGMACVFIFLLLMIFFINLTHILIDKFVLKKKDENKNPYILEKTSDINQSDNIINKSKHIDKQDKDVNNINMTEDIVSAIFSAIKQYEIQKNKSFVKK